MRKVLAVIVFNSVFVKPKVLETSAPPKLINCAALVGNKVTIAPVATVVPVKVMLSAL